MTSWRDSTSPEAQDDLDALFNAGLEAAENFLAKSGEFFPFGVEVDGDELSLFGADPGFGEHPPSVEVLRALVEAARSNRARLEAVGLVSDVSTRGGEDAVRVQLEHREGVALEIVVPYRRRRFGGKVTFGEMAVSGAGHLIWID